jgi:riboflavin kinase/FMN adenylyltransferase
VNLTPEPWRVLPRFGVYAVRVVLPDGGVYAGVTNVGIRPTIVDDDSVTIETYLVDFDGDLYGKTLRVEFLRYLRPERRFDSMAELHRQIEHDVAAARE